MEGVVVSARKAGSTISVSVVSDANGEYRFPPSHLEEGRYALTIKAVGYRLDAAREVTLDPGKPAAADLKLAPTRQLADQLTNAEWMASAPGPDELKQLMLNCIDCHSVQRVFPPRGTARTIS